VVRVEDKAAIEAAGKAEGKSNHRAPAPDSLELWATALSDLHAKLGVPYAGLLIRFYSGDVATEPFAASRAEHEFVSAYEEALASIKEDQVTIFRRSPSHGR
jgi:hypothetical protein